MRREESTFKTLAPKPFRSAKLAEARRVGEALDQLCGSLSPGQRLPKHTELMEQLNASERVVLRTLEEMHSAGRIIRRSGAGTFVAPQDREGSGIGHALEAAASNAVVVISRPDNSFFSRCGDLMLRHAEMLDLTVVYQPIGPGKAPHFVAPPRAGSALGYVVLGGRLLSIAERLEEAGHRVIAIADPAVSGVEGGGAKVACVHVDNVQGSYLAASHLIGLGHRRIAMAMVDEHYAEGPRWDGHVLALREAKMSGIDVETAVLLEDTVNEWDAYPALAAEYFARRDHPTGLCAWNDRTAIKLLTVLLRAGVRVPDQVSLVGYDNLPDDIAVSPQLTTIDQCVDQQVRIALRLLTQVTPPASSHTTLVTPVLVARDSTQALQKP